MTGRLWRFTLAGLPVRGVFVQLGADWPALVAARSYTGAGMELLGQGLAAVPMLLTHLKQATQLTLQISGASSLRLFVVQGDHDLRVRGLIKCDAEHRDFSALEGRLVVTLEPTGSAQQYQGVVPLAGGGLEAWLASYFSQSEQIPSAFKLLADQREAAGLMLQRMPGTQGDDRAWLDAMAQLDIDRFPAEPGEWLSLMLGHDLHLHESEDRVRLSCDCSHERVSRVLLSLDPAEVAALVAEQESVEAECGFCGETYRYTPAEIHELLNASQATPDGSLTH